MEHIKIVMHTVQGREMGGATSFRKPPMWKSLVYIITLVCGPMLQKTLNEDVSNQSKQEI